MAYPPYDSKPPKYVCFSLFSLAQDVCYMPIAICIVSKLVIPRRVSFPLFLLHHPIDVPKRSERQTSQKRLANLPLGE